MSNKNKRKKVFLPNYPDIENYKGSEKTKSDKLRISYIGAVRRYNELKNLMDACKEFEDVFISVHGSGVHTEKLQKIQKNYNNVQVTGKYDFKESARLYSECDILYAMYPMISLQDKVGIPVKYYEAIITKTPVIVSRGKDPAKFIKKQNIGFVLDGNDVGEIRELVDYVRKNRHILQEQMQNLARIQYDYSWDEVVKNLDGAYR